MEASAVRVVCTLENKDLRDLFVERVKSHFQSKGSLINISNKYFSANVELVSDTSSVSSHAEDGIILIGTSKDLRILEPLHDEALQAGAGDLLRLCVVIVADREEDSTKTPKQLEEEYSQSVLWCLDRGYEYISSCDLSDEGIARGHDDRDKEGFARIVEAIRSTVWSTAKQGSPVKVTAEEQTEEEEKKEPQNDDAVSQTKETDEMQEDSKESDGDQEAKARQVLLLQDAETDQSTETGCLDGNDNKDLAKLVQGKREEVVNENFFDQFEGAMREAARIREMSQSGALTDEERRKRAGDAATLLMNLMGDMGFDDDDEDDDE